MMKMAPTIVATYHAYKCKKRGNIQFSMDLISRGQFEDRKV